MSKNRMIALGLVALLHIFLGYAFITGLALKAVKAIVQPLETVNVKEEAPPPEEPPPPPPKDIEIPPFVPPPEVSVANDAPTNAITTQSVVPRPEPPVFVPPAPPAPPAPLAAPTPATAKGRGNIFSDDDFPDASRRAEEAGVTRVSYVVGPDGKVGNCTVTQSSGFPRLDDATCKIIVRRFRFNPATRDGQPVSETKTQPVRWQLKN
ncbi:MAG: energy transducer TonB [Sandarakinorhabdus sp.]|nr:energy transducer TonB [Sandarakinorhabdus sp.]